MNPRPIILLAAILAPTAPAPVAVARAEDGIVTGQGATLPLLPIDPVPLDPGAWSHLGRDTTRVSIAPDKPGIPSDLGHVRWTTTTDAMGAPIQWTSPAGVVIARGVIVGAALLDGVPHALGFDRVTGQTLWATPIPPMLFNSWSTPAIDLGNNTAIVPGLDTLLALDLETGAVRWSSALESLVVNASPMVTTDRGPRDRVYCTDYSFVSPGPGRLYCVNADPRTPQNPFDPGELVWSVPLGGETSGATPAYDGSGIYVADASGRITAFDAGTDTPPAPRWTTKPAPAGEGFFGGICVAECELYAATFDFNGDQLNSTLVKLDAKTGDIRWTTPCGRTDSIPIPISNGRIVLSVGTPTNPLFGSFGSAPAVQLFDDHGNSASLRWDTALDTWHDDGDAVLEAGEFLSVGGWTHHPIADDADTGARLLVGTMPDPGAGMPFGAYVRLSILDLNLHPSDPGFVLDDAPGVGSTPALTDGVIISPGPGGLRAIGGPQ